MGQPYFLPSEVCHKDLPSVSDVKDLDGAVRRTGGEPSPVVVHLGIVLKQTEQNVKTWVRTSTSTFQFKEYFIHFQQQVKVKSKMNLKMLMVIVLW